MGLDSLIPGTEGSTDVVSRKVWINGSELSQEILLHQVSISKVFNKVAGAKLVFVDGSPSAGNFPLSEDDRFKPGNEIEIELGYYGENETVFKGIIVKHGIKINPNAAPSLLIEAKDKAIKLTMSRRSAYYVEQTDSDVISTLAGSLNPEVEASAFQHKQLVQFNATDWDFILTRAEVNSLLVLTDDGKLIAKKPIIETPVVTCLYGSNIIEFDAEMDVRKQVESIQTHSWDYSTQTAEDSGAGSSDFTEAGNLSASSLGAVLGAQRHVNHSGNLTQEQLKDWADAHAMRNKLSKSVGRVRIQGNAGVKPGSTVRLEGVGDRFNGDVFVTGVLHHYHGNWQTDIQFGWNEEWFHQKPDVMEKPASGLLPGVNGLQIGLVIDTEDNDAGGQYRVKVHIPLISSGNEGMWARVAALDAGPERGVYFRPQVNDEVLLGFLNDDPREPVILGSLHSKDLNQSPLPETQGNEEYGFVTKENVKLIFDDTNKRMTLSVQTSGGEKSIILNSSSGALEIKDEHNNSIKMESSGITIEAAGNVTIKGAQVLIN